MTSCEGKQASFLEVCTMPYHGVVVVDGIAYAIRLIVVLVYIFHGIG
jgi:hypothetical protein